MGKVFIVIEQYFDQPAGLGGYFMEVGFWGSFRGGGLI